MKRVVHNGVHAAAGYDAGDYDFADLEDAAGFGECACVMLSVVPCEHACSAVFECMQMKSSVYVCMCACMYASACECMCVCMHMNMI